MMLEKRDNESEYLDILDEIQKNERQLSELKLEKNKNINQLENSVCKVSTQKQVVQNLYQELLDSGDRMAYSNLDYIQDCSHQVSQNFYFQRQCIEEFYNKLTKEKILENEALEKEKGDLEW